MTRIAGERAVLALEDGTVYEGRSFGHAGETTGEVVFNTALSGYQEVLTDPSYAGQIVTMTYPHIGNYGVNVDDVESADTQVAGFVVREASTASSWRSSGELHEYLDDHGVVGITEVDTRALTRHLRDHGAKRGRDLRAGRRPRGAGGQGAGVAVDDRARPRPRGDLRRGVPRGRRPRRGSSRSWPTTSA